jgi:hypothetical protein
MEPLNDKLGARRYRSHTWAPVEYRTAEEALFGRARSP